MSSYPRTSQSFAKRKVSKCQLTTPYTSQQNGVIERKNCTIGHAAYLLNRLPTKALDTRSPYEAWFGKTPHFEHLRVFNCTTHVKTTKPYIKKLDDRSQKMVCFGVEDGTKAHRLYDPQHEKIYVSRDIIFEEEKKWDWSVLAITSRMLQSSLPWKKRKTQQT